MLKDNRAATITGETTLGAGCGHTNGGVWATLKNSGGKLSKTKKALENALAR